VFDKFDKLFKYHIGILLDFNAEVDREDIFKPTIGSERLHEIDNNNGVRVVMFATSRNLAVKVRCSHIRLWVCEKRRDEV
jgi:hypothetical protein